jgi:hypothetical protein
MGVGNHVEATMSWMRDAAWQFVSIIIAVIALIVPFTPEYWREIVVFAVFPMIVLFGLMLAWSNRQASAAVKPTVTSAGQGTITSTGQKISPVVRWFYISLVYTSLVLLFSYFILPQNLKKFNGYDLGIMGFSLYCVSLVILSIANKTFSTGLTVISTFFAAIYVITNIYTNKGGFWLTNGMFVWLSIGVIVVVLGINGVRLGISQNVAALVFLFCLYLSTNGDKLLAYDILLFSVALILLPVLILGGFSARYPRVMTKDLDSDSLGNAIYQFIFLVLPLFLIIRLFILFSKGY